MRLILIIFLESIPRLGIKKKAKGGTLKGNILKNGVAFTCQITTMLPLMTIEGCNYSRFICPVVSVSLIVCSWNTICFSHQRVCELNEEFCNSSEDCCSSTICISCGSANIPQKKKSEKF